MLERFALPLVVLYLARPWPPMLVHHVHEGLQTLTGSLTSAVLAPFATVLRSGHMLRFDGRLFEVIEGCSGLRIEIALLTAILVYAAFLSRSRVQTFGLALIALVAGPLLNVARVVAIMLDSSTEIAQVHATQGLVAVTAGILLIALLDLWLERWLWRSAATASEPSSPSSPAMREGWRGLAALALGAALAVAAGFAPKDATLPKAPEGWALHEIRGRLGAWRRVGSRDIDRAFLGSVKFTNKLHWEFERDDGATALVFAATNNRRRRDYSGYSPKTRTLDAAWESLERSWVELPDLGVPAERTLMRAGAERWWVLHYRVGSRPLAEASLRWLGALDLLPGARPPDLVTVRIAVRANGVSKPRASAYLEELQAEVSAALRRGAPATARERLGWTKPDA